MAELQTVTVSNLPNAATPLTGSERVPMDQTVGSPVAASALVVGTSYRIESVGTTNWTACGLPAGVTATAGLTFVATAAGTGTGTAIEAQTVEATAQAIADLAGAAAGTDLSYEPATRLLSSSTGDDVTLPLFGTTLAGLVGASGGGTINYLRADGTWAAPPGLSGSGTVTSVGLSAPTGFSVSGSPITTTGTLSLAFASGYSLPTDAKQTDWDAAFTQRRTWDGGDQNLNAATGRASLGLGSAAQAAATDFATAAQGSKADTAIQPGTLATALAGKADLVGGLVPSSQLPGFVDDVLEFASLAAFPATGETGKIYVSLATGRIYRWSGSAYIELVGSPGSTDAVPEGSVNLYFTTTRGQAAALSWWSGYASSVGQAVATAVNSAAARSAISAEQAGAAAAAQAAAVQRANHTGTQLAATISDFSAAVAALGTTVGNALRSLVDPSAISFLRINADNTVTARSASEMRGDLGLTSAATATIGTAAGNLVALDAQARLPAVDGSQLTGLPSATIPGGNTTQLQYNNAGTFAGLPTLTTDGTNVTISGRLAASSNGAASAPPLSLTGTWFSGGTATTTKPQFLIEPAGATSNSFSTSGTGFAVNAPSGFAGDLAWFGVNGSRQASISSGGVIASNGLRSTGGLGSAESSAILFGPITSNSVDIVLGRSGGTGYLALGQFGFSDATLVLSSSAVIGFSGSSSVSGFTAFDAALRRDAANALAQRNGTAAQSSRIYNTFTSATNHERAKLEWISNVFLIGTEKGAGGGTARALELQTDGVTRAQISATGVWRNTQPAPAAVNVTATLTIANLQTGIITTTTAAAVDMTLPTGTDVEGGFAVNSNDLAFMWSVINTGSNTATILAATAHTIVGSAAVAGGSSGRFTTRRTAANTYVTYRLS